MTEGRTFDATPPGEGEGEFELDGLENNSQVTPVTVSTPPPTRRKSVACIHRLVESRSASSPDPVGQLLFGHLLSSCLTFWSTTNPVAAADASIATPVPVTIHGTI